MVKRGFPLSAVQSYEQRVGSGEWGVGRSEGTIADKVAEVASGNVDAGKTQGGLSTHTRCEMVGTSHFRRGWASSAFMQSSTAGQLPIGTVGEAGQSAANC